MQRARTLSVITVAACALALSGCSDDKKATGAIEDPQLQPTASAAASPSSTPGPSLAPIVTGTLPVITDTSVPTPTPTVASPRPSPSATPSPTPTPTPRKTVKPTPRPTNTTGAPSSGTITINNHAYSTLTIARNGTITVVNEDPQAHTVTDADHTAFDHNVPPSATNHFSAPSAPGTYGLVCNYHSDMSGTLIVK